MSIHRISLQCLARLTGSSFSPACRAEARSTFKNQTRGRSWTSWCQIRVRRSLILLVPILCTSAAFAAPPSSHENLSAAGDAALQSDDINLAIEKYTAIHQPSDETTYNLGIAYYRNGELQQAANQFRKVIGSQNDSVAARARFNLGNAFYAQALTKLAPADADATPPDATGQGPAVTPAPAGQPNFKPDVEGGLKLLRSAITQYRTALRIDANDTDARANIELAQSLIDQIDQQQQDQQQQDQQQQDQQQQDQQQQDQQQQDQQQQDQQQQDQQRQDQQQDSMPDQKTPTSEEQAEPTEDEDKDDASPVPTGELTTANEQDESLDPKRREPAIVNTDQMTEEEARKLLQSIRDRDMLRRLRKRAAERALRVPVERDW